MKSGSTHLEKSKSVPSLPPQRRLPWGGTPANVPRSQLLVASVSVASRLLTIPVFLLDFAQGGWRNVVQGQHSIFSDIFKTQCS